MNCKYNDNFRPNLKLEIDNLRNKNCSSLIGVDEVGRGSWAGPIVACSCWIDPKRFKDLPNNINDSKKLSENQRNEVYKKIKDLTIFGVSIATNDEIERYGLSLSNSLAIKRSLFSLLNCRLLNLNSKRFSVYVDGKYVPDFNLLNKKSKLPDAIPLPPHSIQSLIRGDQKVLSISLASIIAKVTRDTIMKQYDQFYPEYKFRFNKGYGTKEHNYILQKMGMCDIHRKNFKPMSTIFS